MQIICATEVVDSKRVLRLSHYFRPPNPNPNPTLVPYLPHTYTHYFWSPDPYPNPTLDPYLLHKWCDSLTILDLQIPTLTPTLTLDISLYID